MVICAGLTIRSSWMRGKDGASTSYSWNRASINSRSRESVVQPQVVSLPRVDVHGLLDHAGGMCSGELVTGAAGW